MKKSVLVKILFFSLFLLVVPFVIADYGDVGTPRFDVLRTMLGVLGSSSASMVGGAECADSVSKISVISSTSSMKVCNYLYPGRVISIFDKVGSDVTKVGSLVDHFELAYQQCSWVTGIVSTKEYLMYEWYCKGSNQMCTPGNVCVNSGARAYQNADCSTPSITSCQYGCLNGVCTIPVTPNTCSVTKLCQGSSLYQQNADCSKTLISDCPNGCVLNSCASYVVPHPTPTPTPPPECSPNDVQRCNGNAPETCVFGEWMPNIDPATCQNNSTCTLIEGYAICSDPTITKCDVQGGEYWCADLGMCVKDLKLCNGSGFGRSVSPVWIYIAIGVIVLLIVFKPYLKRFIQY